jgi:hypothetical protein
VPAPPLVRALLGVIHEARHLDVALGGVVAHAEVGVPGAPGEGSLGPRQHDVHVGGEAAVDEDHLLVPGSRVSFWAGCWRARAREGGRWRWSLARPPALPARSAGISSSYMRSLRSHALLLELAHERAAEPLGHARAHEHREVEVAHVRLGGPGVKVGAEQQVGVEPHELGDPADGAGVAALQVVGHAARHAVAVLELDLLAVLVVDPRRAPPGPVPVSERAGVQGGVDGKEQLVSAWAGMVRVMG